MENLFIGQVLINLVRLSVLDGGTLALYLFIIQMGWKDGIIQVF